VNSNISKQWLFDKYAMKAASVQGAGEVFAKISRNPGLRTQYGPCTSFGIATLSGRVGGDSSADMISLSSLLLSHSVTDDAGDAPDLVEEEEEKVDSCEEDLREIITRGRSCFLLLRPPLPPRSIVTTLLAKHSRCRKGSWMDATLPCP
jgi:hypothetical protein